MSQLAAREGSRPQAADWRALGTHVRVAVTEPAALDPARALLATELGAIDLACSRFRDDSEVMRLTAAGGRWQSISPLLAEAVEIALHAARVTDGDVDPTVGRSLEALGYDRDFTQLTAAAGTLTVVPRPCPGWQQVELDRDALRIRVPDGLLLDLGATAKALAADHAAARIGAVIEGGVLVSLGGDIALAGATPPDGWPVRVTDGTADDPAATGQTIALRSGGLATSSTAVRRWQRGAVAMHHIVDPGSGLPARPVWRTVSVNAASCVEANIASTAAIVRGERALGWLTGLGVPARLRRTDGRTLTLGGWPEDRG